MMRHKIILVSVLLSACGIPHLTPYKMDVRQGNYVTQEMRDKLKVGMTKQQVRYVLGTPLVNDAFHDDRWDYAYSLAKRGQVEEHQTMTLFFNGDTLARIDDKAMPVSVPIPTIEMVPQEVVLANAPTASANTSEPDSVATLAASVAPDSDAIKASVQAWAAAWSARDVSRYVASYTADFHPDELTHRAWQKLRDHRLHEAKNINVKLSDMAITTQDANHATADFHQHYHSNLHDYTTHKTLRLEKRDAAWLIVNETIED